MFTHSRLYFLSAVVLIAAWLPVQTKASDKNQSITVFQSGQALMTDTREFSLNRGSNQIVFDEISTMISPSSVFAKFDGDVGKISIQQKRYGLEEYIGNLKGEQVTLIAPNGENISGKITHFQGGMVSIEDTDGQTQLIPQIYNYRIITEAPGLQQPEGTIVSVNVDAPRRGSQLVSLIYQFGGLEWLNDYVVVLADDEKSARLESRAVITNNSGMDITDASLRLMAGDLNRVQPEYGHNNARMVTMEYAMADDIELEQAGFFEYQRIDLPELISINHSETRTIPIFNADDVKTEKQFFFRASWMGNNRSNADVSIRFAFDNSEDAGLGRALPAGKLQMYKEDGARTELVGEQNIRSTQVDQKFHVQVGKAFDLRVNETQLDFSRTGNVSREERKITIHSTRDESTTVQVEIPLRRNETITGEDIFDRNKINIDVPANGSAEYTFRITRTDR